MILDIVFSPWRCLEATMGEIHTRPEMKQGKHNTEVMNISVVCVCFNRRRLTLMTVAL